jgi:signal transduction histidine kinase
MRTALFKSFQLFLILFCFFFIGACSDRKISPKAVKGVLDLRGWDFERDGNINLDGEWEFYWEEFPTVADGGELILPGEKRDFITVPSSWNGHVVRRSTEKGEKIEEEAGSEGFATYHLKVILNEPRTLSFAIPAQSTAYRFLVDNIVQLKMGEVGREKDNSIPERINLYKTLSLSKNEFTLTIQVSNFHRYDAGLFKSINLGLADSINQSRINRVALDLFVAGILFIMGVYHLSLYYLRREDSLPFYFGIYSILISIRTLIMGDIYLVTIIPNLPFSLNLFLEFFTIYLGLPIFNEFISRLFPQEVNTEIKKIIAWIGYLFSSTVVIFSFETYTFLLLFYQIFLLLFIIYTIFIFIKATYNRRQGSKTILLGFLFFSISVINDILYANNIINTGDLFPYGFVFFIFSQAFLLTVRFARAFHQVKDLSFNLEKRVKERTNDLELANVEVKKASEMIELSLQRANQLNEMMQVIIQSKSVDEFFQKIFDLFSNRYRLKSYLVYIHDNSDGYLKLFKKFGDAPVSDDYEKTLHKNHLSIKDRNSIQGNCFNFKKSFIAKKIRLPHPYKPEEENIIEGGITSFYIIPLIMDNESFGTIIFSDSKFQKSDIQGLTKSDREEIENFIKLISPSIYQSLQKQKIEAAYKELQETQSQLIEAERMASLGQLVGGIAHEINNPIAVIHSHAELLEYNNHITLREVPPFLETLTPPEKTIFYGIVDRSVKNRIFLNSKEERKQRKDTEKLLLQIVEDEDLRTTLSESLVHLRLPPPYETYIQELGAERFSKFLSMAEVFKNQSNSLSSIEIAVEKASRVIFALRSYLNTELSSSRKEVDLVKELDKALHVYDNYVMGKINIRQDFPKELKYTCVAENIAQVWKNLFFNSIQAMYTTDKKLEILLEQFEKLPETLKDYKTSSIVEESLFQKDSGTGWILVSITDSGTGISPELQDKVFTPFFTTKSLGEGIGLGLYTSKKIIHEHGGALFFKSEEGRTEFVVVLPS